MNVYRVEDAYVLSFENCTVQYKIINNERCFFHESFNYPIHPDEFIFRRKPTPEQDAVMLKNCCSLYKYSAENYWHFTFESLPTLLTLEKQGYDGVYIIYSDSDRPYIYELLSILKITPERIIESQTRKVFHAENLYISEPVMGQRIKPELLRTVREAVLKNIDCGEPSRYPKRLYVPRVTTRKVRNESEVLELLKNKYNFEVMVPEEFSVEEQIKHFYHADIVVAPHGAAAANALYMKENSCFVELFTNNYVNPCMFRAIKLLNLNYAILPEIQYAPEFSKPLVSFSTYNEEDCNVNIELLDLTVGKMCPLKNRTD